MFTQSATATGPPRSCAGVGVGILRGFVVFWESERLKKRDLPKIQRFHDKSTKCQNISALFQNYFWCSKIYLCFEILKIFRFLFFTRFHHRNIFENARRSQVVWIQRSDLPKVPRFHANPNMAKTYRHFPKLFLI